MLHQSKAGPSSRNEVWHHRNLQFPDLQPHGWRTTRHMPGGLESMDPDLQNIPERDTYLLQRKLKHKTYYKEMQNDTKRSQNNHKDMQNDYKEIESNYKEAQNDHKETKNCRHANLLFQCGCLAPMYCRRGGVLFPCLCPEAYCLIIRPCSSLCLAEWMLAGYIQYFICQHFNG